MTAYKQHGLRCKRCVIFFICLLAACNHGATVDAVTFSCDPCIDRSNYKVKGITHGVKGVPFWQQVQASMLQAQKDMRIDLEVELYDNMESSLVSAQMVKDITEAANSEDNKPDALIVTLPTTEVQDAVKAAVESGMPVFGFNSGYKVATELGVKDFVALDEALGGKMAGAEFLANMPNGVKKALYVYHDEDNSALIDRLDGYTSSLKDQEEPAEVTSVFVDLHQDEAGTVSSLDEIFEGCPYDTVLLAGSILLEKVMNAYENNGCSYFDQKLGTFDKGNHVYSAMEEGKVLFAVSQQQWLQAALPVVFASLFVTVGQALVVASDSEHGIYLSGPVILNSENLPPTELRVCEDDAFPVCPNTLAPDGVTESTCACTDRNKITIGGVVHGVTTDPFWDVVFAGAEQAAVDFDVNLKFTRLEPGESSADVHARMAVEIAALCESGVDGIFVTIPSDTVIESIKACQELNVPVIAINSGAKSAESLGLMKYIGQLEYNAGFGSGERLLENGTTRGLCVIHEEGNIALEERCDGFRDALAQGDAPAGDLGRIYVPFDDEEEYMSIIEAAVGEEGDWDGVGLFLVGATQLGIALPGLKENHPGVLIGVVDTSEKLYESVDSGDVLFGIDQQAYEQGYMPVPFLMYKASVDQQLVNKVVDTGPSFVYSAPTQEQRTCEANLFAACHNPTVTVEGDNAVVETAGHMFRGSP